MNVDSIKQLLLNQFQELLLQFRYDFVYDEADGKLLCQVVKRDFEGSIIGTPLMFHLSVNEEEGTGEVIYYNVNGEFKRQQFDVFVEGSLNEVFDFISGRLSVQ